MSSYIYIYICKRFIDDLTAISDGGEYGRSISEIYPDELELKAEHVLNFDISVVDGRFIYKLFDNRDEFPFLVSQRLAKKRPKESRSFVRPLVTQFLENRSLLFSETFAVR